jgi:anti-sigma factor RsiW
MGMNRFERMIDSYLDGELSGEEMLWMRRMIEENSEYAAIYRQAKKLKGALIRYGAQECEALLAAEDRIIEMAKSGGKPKSVSVTGFRRTTWAAASIAILVVMAVGYTFNQNTLKLQTAENERAVDEFFQDAAFLGGGDPLSASAGVTPVIYRR